jgi:hypothetical protein
MQIVRVVNGTMTVLGQIESPDYLTGIWASVTLYVSGTNIRASVQRLDKSTYLNASGQWQPTPAWALNLTDTAISGGGLIGLGRPGSYSGTITFDNFAASPVTGDTIAPTVAITAPAPGSTLSGVVTVQGTDTDNVGVTRLEFYVDNVLEATIVPHSGTPFLWNLNTTALTNGQHALQVLGYDAAGNVGTATETVVVQNNLALPQPVIPQHYPQIRIAELAYSGNPMGSVEDQLLQNSVDLVVANPTYLQQINSISPNTPQLLYQNVSNIYLSLLTDWDNYADGQGISRESAFYHVAAATPFSGDSPSSQPVNWFWGVYRGGSALTNLIGAADGSTAGGLTLAATGQSVYIGYPEQFREIKFNLASGAAAGWSGVLEYATAVDSAGNPTAWAPVPLLSDSTAGFTKSGQILFDPPAGWQTAAVGGSARLFYVRVRTATGGTAPVANTILGDDYVHANGTTSGVIPAFDYAADVDHDGYLNDAEYANHAPGMDARFAYQSRLFYPGYGQMRFVTNPASLGFQSWAVNYTLRFLAGYPLADGLFEDNSGGNSPIAGISVLEPTAAYGANFGALLSAIGQAIAPRWILANTASGGSAADSVISHVQGYFEEFAIRALADNYQQFESLAMEVAHRASLTTPSPYAVLDSLPTGGDPSDPRTQIATLAYYYLLANPTTTFLDFFGGYAPATTWSQHWSPAAAYNIGSPLGTWSDFASGADPSNAALTYHVYQRTYANALVLYRPLSYGGGVSGTLANASATVLALSGTYYLLNADGTLGPPITSISFRNGEGAILIKASAVASKLAVSGFPATKATGSPPAFTVSVLNSSSNAVSGPGDTPAPPVQTLATVLPWTLAVPDLRATAGTTFSGPVATFSDNNPGVSPSSFTATITWGNGQTTAGTASGSNGNFTVSGSMTYAQEGRYPLSVTVRNALRNTSSGSGLAHVARLGALPSLLGPAAYDLSHSVEYYSDLITAAYQKYLGRQPGPSEVALWVSALENGMSDETMESGFIASPEYSGIHGGYGAGWIIAMYQDLLARTPSQSEVKLWIQALDNGMAPNTVAYYFATSVERKTRRITADYQKYLGRTPSQSEITPWVNAFEQGFSNENVIADFTSSLEFFRYDRYDNVDDWIYATYEDVLGREPDPQGFQGWRSLLINS